MTKDGAGFSAWRITPLDVLRYALTLPKPGLYEVRLDASADCAARIAFDDGQSYSVSAADAFVLVKRAASAAFLELAVPADVRSLQLRRSCGLRLARAIAARRDIARRRAMTVLLRGDMALAIAMMEAGANVSAAEYRAWLSQHEPSVTQAMVGAHIANWPRPPRFSIVMTAWNSNIPFLQAAIESVQAQAYPHWHLFIADDASDDPRVRQALTQMAKADPRIRVTHLAHNGGISAATNSALAMADGAWADGAWADGAWADGDWADGDWIAFLDHDDTLSPDALALAADAIVNNPQARILYTDEDKIDGSGGRSDPYFKPDWNRELFYAQNYLNHLTLIRRDLVVEAGPLRSPMDGSQDYDLLLRCIARVDDNAIVHVPFVCYHWRFATRGGNFSIAHADKARAAALAALNAHLAATSHPADAEAVAGTPYWRARRRAGTELVSLIIPTRDRKALLETAIESILAAREAYPHFEILVADNDSKEPATIAYLRALELRGVARVIPTPGPFNFARINNEAAAMARGAILGFINNDVQVLNHDWLAQMVSHFARAAVAAVGAKLFYSDGRVQHAGVVTGIGGVAGHIYKHREQFDRGPSSHLLLPRETSAVTGACLLVRAEAFEAVNGFDEHAFPVAFNDIDLCLKLRLAGHRIVWTPFARLTHFESSSRGPDQGPRFEQEKARMMARWGAALALDPYYNPNLNLANEGGGLAFPPRVSRPWSRP